MLGGLRINVTPDAAGRVGALIRQCGWSLNTARIARGVPR